jgi:hypothetical protein
MSLIEWRSSPLDVDQLIISAARSNPRRLIRLCQQLFDQHWKAHPHQAMLLEEEAIDTIRRFQ